MPACPKNLLDADLYELLACPKNLLDVDLKKTFLLDVDPDELAACRKILLDDDSACWKILLGVPRNERFL